MDYDEWLDTEATESTKTHADAMQLEDSQPMDLPDKTRKGRPRKASSLCKGKPALFLRVGRWSPFDVENADLAFSALRGFIDYRHLTHLAS